VSLYEGHGYGIGASSIRDSSRCVLLDRDSWEDGFGREDERARRLATRTLRISHMQRRKGEEEEEKEKGRHERCG
jgi:hypothetical protein